MKVVLFYQPGAGHLEALSRAAPGAEIAIAGDEGQARLLAPEAEVIMGNRFFLQTLGLAERLRWFQSNSVGMDLILDAGGKLKGITITSARGVYDREMAEHGLALCLALARGIHVSRDRQRSGRWVRTGLRVLGGARALIIGYGGVGMALARHLADIGMKVTAARRRPGIPEGSDPRVRVVWGDGWRAELPAADVLVLALPLTRATRAMVDGSAIAAMKPGSLLVNIGRGATLAEGPLIEALRRGHLGGAALDVFETEPLPEDSPLWDQPELLITPHVARSREEPPCRWEPLFEENLRRYASGQRLLNVVDVEEGY